MKRAKITKRFNQKQLLSMAIIVVVLVASGLAALSYRDSQLTEQKKLETQLQEQTKRTAELEAAANKAQEPTNSSATAAPTTNSATKPVTKPTQSVPQVIPKDICNHEAQAAALAKVNAATVSSAAIYDSDIATINAQHDSGAITLSQWQTLTGYALEHERDRNATSLSEFHTELSIAGCPY